MKQFSTYTFFLSMAIIFYCLCSCRKEKQYDTTPQIALKTVTQIGDTAFNITLTFSDGDGDIGLQKSDTLAPFNPGSQYYYDCFVKVYYKQNGAFIEYVTPFPFNYRIPDISPKSRNKNISGDISVDVLFFPLTFADTLKCDIHILDRALHQSNTVTTNEFVYK